MCNSIVSFLKKCSLILKYFIAKKCKASTETSTSHNRSEIVNQGSVITALKKGGNNNERVRNKVRILKT